MLNDKRINWLSVFIYSILAILISAPFHLNIFHWNEQLNEITNFEKIKFILEGIGPIVGGFICLFAFKNSHHRVITLFGKKPLLSLLAILTPVLVGAIVGIKMASFSSRHYAGIYVVIYTLFYCFFEEFGWRGFLQDALRPLLNLWKYLIIGSIWYVWHLSFLHSSTSILNELIFLVILILSSWGIGVVADATKSILIVTVLHFLVNILFLNSLFKEDFSSRLIIVGISFIFLFIIMKKSGKEIDKAVA